VDETKDKADEERQKLIKDKIKVNFWEETNGLFTAVYLQPLDKEVSEKIAYFNLNVNGKLHLKQKKGFSHPSGLGFYLSFFNLGKNFPNTTDHLEVFAVLKDGTSVKIAQVDDENDDEPYPTYDNRTWFW
ncbi:hypothetical protein, partial [Bacillus sp. AR18-7]|uniref:hypothetical protein n=1 Tax=Bacillus sp. AR18-7 TaxID=2217821 RepID=UPI0013C99CF6